MSPSNSVRLSERGIVLASLPDSEWELLFAVTSGEQWRALRVFSIEQILGMLQQWPCAVVVTAPVLSDGDWRDLLAAVSPLHLSPQIVVMDRNADDASWLDVLDAGGFDLLRPPVQERDLAHVLRLAESSWLASLADLGGGWRRRAAGDH
ncbi:MAG: hypothetical protein NZV14_15410 [Bryobacteraceae bacterium]|nr:hypothetical protein [Bryobacteraceae bacterium]MDW8379550.1 hypothetical protein [Bryobacterales bacterium]